MAKLRRLGDLERAVMDHLWDTDEPQTVREVREALCSRREMAYTTIMTVLHRLARKSLVDQIREDRAFRYAPTHGRDELVARLMVDALDQVADRDGRQAALVHFVERVGVDETDALRRALAEVDSHRHGRRDQSYSDQHRGFDSTVPQRLSRGYSGLLKAFDGEGIPCSAS